MSGERRGFPFVLTVTALVAIAALVGLGVWQVRRLTWKTALLAQIAALSTAPARPLAEVLAAAGSMEFRRVMTGCQSAPAGGETLFRYAVRDGRIGWRLLGVCRVAAGPYDGIVVDRGLVELLMGATSPRPLRYGGPQSVVGVLRSPGDAPLLGAALMEKGQGFAAWRLLDRASLARIAAGARLTRPAPYILAAERETPPLAGVTPAALPQDIPNNHLVYALTWFALAAILAWFYGAMMFRRLRR